MTIQWHLMTGARVDVLRISGHLGDEAVPRFNGAVGWAVARGSNTLLLDCTRLQGWSAAGRSAVDTASTTLHGHARALELVSPPTPVTGLATHTALDAALTHHGATEDDHSAAAWQSDLWD